MRSRSAIGRIALTVAIAVLGTAVASSVGAPPSQALADQQCQLPEGGKIGSIPAGFAGSTPDGRRTIISESYWVNVPDGGSLALRATGTVTLTGPRSVFGGAYSFFGAINWGGYFQATGESQQIVAGITLTSPGYVHLYFENGYSVTNGSAHTFSLALTLLDAEGNPVDPGSNPCIDLAVDTVKNCADQGGNYYFAQPTEIDGQTYQGCFHYDSCVSNLPSFLGQLQEWSCENNDLLIDILKVGAVAAVTTLVVIGASAVFVAYSPQIVAGLRALATFAARNAANEGGFTSAISFTARTAAKGSEIAVPLPVVVVLAAAVGLAIGTAMPWLIDTINGGVTAATEQIFATRVVAKPATAALTVAVAAATMRTRCIEDLNLGAVAQELQASGLADTFPMDVATGLVVVNGVTSHICDLVPVYLPGGSTPSGINVGAATLHMRDVLYGEDNQPDNYSANTAVSARPEWAFLTRAKHPQFTTDRRWYRKLPTPCDQGNISQQCDEWPWFTTFQGGPTSSANIAPRAHLRYIDPLANKASGFWDYGVFYRRCKVPVGEPFLVVPQTVQMIETGTPSFYLCPAVAP